MRKPVVASALVIAAIVWTVSLSEAGAGFYHYWQRKAWCGSYPATAFYYPFTPACGYGSCGACAYGARGYGYGGGLDGGCGDATCGYGGYGGNGACGYGGYGACGNGGGGYGACGNGGNGACGYGGNGYGHRAHVGFHARRHCRIFGHHCGLKNGYGYGGTGNQYGGCGNGAGCGYGDCGTAYDSGYFGDGACMDGACMDGACIDGQTFDGTPVEGGIISSEIIPGSDVPVGTPVEDPAASVEGRKFHLAASVRHSGKTAFDRGLGAMRQHTMSEAVNQFNAAIEAEPQNPLYRYHLALVMYDLHGADAANDARDKAIELEQREPIKDWGKRMERVQGRARVWVEQARREAGLH